MIRALPDHLVNQIAAGEVVERPASVVKELVENAIDAGSTQIDIRLEDAGKTSIEIRDDGHGMAPEQLPLAVQRHATSKLQGNDLTQISTRGFRGEALPSIASVASVTLTSRTKANNSAWMIENKDSTWSSPRPVAGKQGTTILVSGLFRTTPARLKFLRSDTAERAAIKSILIDLALSAPDVALILSESGKTLLDIPIPIDSRISRLFGADFVGSHIDMIHVREEIEVRVLAGYPTLNRATSAGVIFLVNDRPVDDKRLMGVVRAAYRDFVPKGRFPVLLASLTLPAAQVDVNVHPAKTEVRFRDPAGASSALMGALKKALRETPAHSSGHLGSSLPDRFSSFSQPAATSAPTVQQSVLALSSQAPLKIPQIGNSGVEHFQEPEQGAALGNKDQPLGTPIGLLHKTYILSQTLDGFCLIDMHAAHERLVYERLKQQQAKGSIPRQALLVPDVVTLGEDQAAAVLAHSNSAADLGLVYEGFGNDAVLIREVPALLAQKADWPQMLKDMAEVLAQDGAEIPLAARMDFALATLACYTSVRSGRQLNLAEMDALLRQMEAEPASGQCNHGRPTSVMMSLSQLENLFERA